jgi:uracil-DNA glycosylase
MATPLKRKAADVATSTAKKPKANASITSFFSSPASSAKPVPTASTTVSSPPAAAGDDSSQKSTASLGTTTPASTLTAAGVAPAASAALPALKFDKAKWIEKLTPEQKDLLALEIQSLDESWLAQLKDEVVSKDFLNLKRFLKQEHEGGKKIFPPASDVYAWYVSPPNGSRS